MKQRWSAIFNPFAPCVKNTNEKIKINYPEPLEGIRNMLGLRDEI